MWSECDGIWTSFRFVSRVTYATYAYGSERCHFYIQIAAADLFTKWFSDRLQKEEVNSCTHLVVCARLVAMSAAYIENLLYEMKGYTHAPYNLLILTHPLDSPSRMCTWFHVYVHALLCRKYNCTVNVITITSIPWCISWYNWRPTVKCWSGSGSKINSFSHWKWKNALIWCVSRGMTC